MSMSMSSDREKFKGDEERDYEDDTRYLHKTHDYNTVMSIALIECLMYIEISFCVIFLWRTRITSFSSQDEERTQDATTISMTDDDNYFDNQVLEKITLYSPNIP